MPAPSLLPASPPSPWRTTRWSSASVSTASRASSAALHRPQRPGGRHVQGADRQQPYGRTLRHWDRATGSWQEEHTFIEPLNGVTGSSSWSTASAAPPVSELYGVYGRLATLCEEAGIHLVRNLIGPYCTSLDMTGISITCSRWMTS